MGSPGGATSGVDQAIAFATARGDGLPLRRVPTFGRRADGRVLAEEDERGQVLEAERLHQRAIRVDERRLALLLVAEDPLARSTRCR